MADIDIQHIYKQFSDKKVFTDLTVTVKEKRITAVTGRSGCGKTTLIRMLAGLDMPDSGRIIGLPSSVSIVFQEDRLLPGMPVINNFKSIKGRSFDLNQTLQIISELGLEKSCLYLKESELSGGMKRRIAIARALSFPADLYLMDEPFKGLDDSSKTLVMDTVFRYCCNKTLIFVTHDLSEIPSQAEVLDIS